MTKTFITVLGIVLLLIGVLGFIHPISPDGKLFAIFSVGTGHNVFHLIAGALALLSVRAGERETRLYAQVFGIIFGLMTILGFIQGSGANVFGFISVNQPDNVLNLVIAAAAVYVGFGGEPAQRSKKA